MCIAAMARKGDEPEKLRWGKYSPIYRRRLLEGATALQKFLAGEGIRQDIIREGKSCEIDMVLDPFVHAMHKDEKRSSFSVAKHAVLFVQILRPRPKKRLQSTWSTLKAWEELKPSEFRMPLPLPLLVAIVCKSRLFAVNAVDRKTEGLWYNFAALVMTGFFGLLRPGELLSITAKDVSLPHSLSLAAPHAVIRLCRPKNSRHLGIQQFVSITNPDAINWLSWMVLSKKEPDRPLWQSTDREFRRMFSTVTEALKIKSLKFSPASLRAGGATWLIDEGVEVSKIRFLGRWTNMNSLEHYVQVARAQQLTLSILPKVAANLKNFIAQHTFLLSLPQFLHTQALADHLLATVPLVEVTPHDVVRATRDWARSEEAVQKSSGSKWAAKGGSLF